MPPTSNRALSKVHGKDCRLSGVAQAVDGAGRGKRCLAWVAIMMVEIPRTPASFLNTSAHWWLDLRLISIGRAAAGDLTEIMSRSHVVDIDYLW
jgi:hypothetical protein